MNNNDLQRILRRGDGRLELPPDVAGRVQADMHDELDRTLGTADTVVSLHSAPSSPSRRSRFLVPAAAAVFVIAATAGLLLSQREPDINEADQAQEVPIPPPPTPQPQPYLVACLDFIGSTSIDEEPWHDVLASTVPSIPPEYPATLATAIDKLLATSPEARIAASRLQAAATEARSVDPDPDLIILQLESAQDVLFANTFVQCLTTSEPDESPD